MNNKLKLITDVENTTGISIIDENDLSGLVYYDSEKYQQVKITGDDSNLKLIYATEFQNKLTNRDWNIATRKYISFDNFNNEILSVKLTNGIAPIDELDISSSVIGKPIANPLDIPISIVDNFRETYKDVLEYMNKNEIYLYNSFRSTVDLYNNSTTINVIPFESDIYTNTLSLRKLIENKVAPNISGKVDLEIQFVKGGEVRTNSLVFEAFNYDTEGRMLFIDNIINDSIEGIIIEYLGGIIRVIPTDDILECIISNCTVTYGNLK